MIDNKNQKEEQQQNILMYEDFAEQRKARWEKGDALKSPVKFRFKLFDWVYDEPEGHKAKYEIQDDKNAPVVKVDVHDVLPPNTLKEEFMIMDMNVQLEDMSGRMIPACRPCSANTELSFLNTGELFAQSFFEHKKTKEQKVFIEEMREHYQERSIQDEHKKGHSH